MGLGMEMGTGIALSAYP